MAQVLQKKRLVFGDKHMARVVAAASRAHGSGGMATSTGGAGTEVWSKPWSTPRPFQQLTPNPILTLKPSVQAAVCSMLARPVSSSQF